MIVRERVPLSQITSFKSGGEALLVAECSTEEDVVQAIVLAKEKKIPFYVLGEGSNVLAQDTGYHGVVIVIQIDGYEYVEHADSVEVKVGAGVIWDTFVRIVAEKNLWGVENLAGIPGSVGAAPVQNIGAYGAELQDTFSYVEVVDAETLDVMRLQKEVCAFGYRDSIFKHKKNLVILHVGFVLSKVPHPLLSYNDLQKSLQEGADLTNPTAIGTVVRSIRANKFPDRTIYGTAGSFFKNPILTKEQYEGLVATYGEVPQFPNPKGIKIPLAFILDKVLNLRGFRLGHAWLFGAQPLVLVLDAEGVSNDVEMLAQEIEKRVFNETGITIEREVRTLV